MQKRQIPPCLKIADQTSNIVQVCPLDLIQGLDLSVNEEYLIDYELLGTHIQEFCWVY